MTREPRLRRRSARPARPNGWLARHVVLPVLAVAVLAAAALAGVSVPAQSRAPVGPLHEGDAEQEAGGDFAGPEACAGCHAERYAEWSASTHGRAGGPPGPETVVAPFAGEPILFADARVVPTVDARGRYVFRVEREGRDTLVFEVAGVIGRGHMLGGGTQGFVSAFPDGTRRFLPFDWSVTGGAWFCNTTHVAGWWVAGGARPELRPDVGWAPITPETKLTDCGDWPPVRVLGTDRRYANCQQCHGSRIDLAFDADAGLYRTEYGSLAIDCESCHGPALRHVEAAQAAAGGDDANPDPDALAIRSLANRGADEALEVCLRCHALKRRIAPGYLPGDDLEAHYSFGLPFLGDRPYYADGKVRSFAYQLNHLYSPCWFGGGMRCEDCHAPHTLTYRDVSGLPLRDPFDDGQCLGCHPSKAFEPERHTFHPSGSEGSACVGCHMPYRQQPGIGERVPYGRADHTISIPRPGTDERAGVPSACALCHADVPTQRLEVWARDRWGELATRPALVEAVARARAAGVGREEDRVAPEDLLVLDEPLDLLQVVALNELLLGWLRPDMHLPDGGVAPADRELVDGLESLVSREAGVGGVGEDVAATALALLHVGWGEVPRVRALLDARAGAGAAGPGSALRLRWGRTLQQTGATWTDRGRPGDALRAFERSQEVLPDDAEVLLDLAVALGRGGRVEESLPYYVRSLQLDPTQSYGFVNLGLTLERLGRESEAEGVYRRAVAAFAWEALGHVNLGNVHLRRGALAEAAGAYARSLEIDPSLALAAYYLAVSRVNLNDLAGARRALRQSLEFAPDDPDARELLRRIDEATR